MKGFALLRSDGKWYNGTADHTAKFSDVLTTSGVYKSEDEAVRRIEGLKKDSEYSYEAIPIQVHG